MNSLPLVVMIFSVLVGLLCGGLIVFLLFTARRKILANSLTHTDACIGHIGTVQIPFDYRSKGKIRLSLDHSNKELVAFTDYPHEFKQGDRVLVVQIARETHAWVVPGNIFED